MRIIFLKRYSNPLRSLPVGEFDADDVGDATCRRHFVHQLPAAADPGIRIGVWSGLCWLSAAAVVPSTAVEGLLAS